MEKLTIAVMPSATFGGGFSSATRAGNVRVTGSATGETSRRRPSIGSPPAQSLTVMASARCSSASCCSGIPISTSFSPVRARRITDWPALTTWPTSASTEVDDGVVRGPQYRVTGLIAARLGTRLGLLVMRFGGIERSLAPVEFGLADEPLRLQVLEAPVVGALLIAVNSGCRQGSGGGIRREAVVLGIDRCQSLAGG